MKVTMAGLLVAKPDSADNDIDAAVSQVLRMRREKIQLDVVFVSKSVGGKWGFRQVAQVPGHEAIAVGQCDPLEDSLCQWVVGRAHAGNRHRQDPLQASGQAPATSSAPT